MMAMTTEAVCQYRKAHASLSVQGFDWEIEWQRSLKPVEVTETLFLRELAWVVLSSGFRESVVRRKFSYISLCFCDWSSAEEIAMNAASCQATALLCFGNRQKVNAILAAAINLWTMGFEGFRECLFRDPIKALQQFDYIGEVTSYHLAKNLGFQVAKPDRHLVRLSRTFGFTDVQKFCQCISDGTGDPINVVDLILWRYSVLGSGQNNPIPKFQH